MSHAPDPILKRAINTVRDGSVWKGAIANFLGNILSWIVIVVVTWVAGPSIAVWRGWVAPVTWVTSIGVLLCLLGLGFVYFYFRKTPARVFDEHGTSHPQTRLPYPIRRILGLAFIAVLVLAAVELAAWKYYESRPPNKIIILVADFDPQDTQHQVTQMIVEHLKDATKQYPDTRIEHLRRFISWEEGGPVASEEGRRRKATIVLWGNYGKTSTSARIIVHFQILNRNAAPTLQLKKESETLTLALSELESFTIQERISKQMGYLTLLVVGVARYSAGDNRGAISYFDAALRESEVPQELIDPDALYSYRGKAHFNLGDFDACIADQQQILALKPDSVDAHSDLAAAFTIKGLYDDAIAEGKKAIALKRDFPVAHNNLGIALWSKGDLDGAIAEFREALRLKPSDAKAHNNLGATLWSKGDPDAAISEYREALRLNPSYANADDNLGAALSSKGDLDGAISEYREALRLEPHDPRAHYNLGLALFDKHDLDGAMAEYREALRLRPDYAKAHNNLGSALRDKHDLDGAMAEYREALRLKPHDADAHYNLGVAP